MPNSLLGKEDTTPVGSACTNACTGKAETAQAANLETLAAALLTLSPADGAKLAAMLLGQQPRQGQGRGATP